jgi:hypothetical protein
VRCGGLNKRCSDERSRALLDECRKQRSTGGENPHYRPGGQSAQSLRCTRELRRGKEFGWRKTGKLEVQRANPCKAHPSPNLRTPSDHRWNPPKSQVARYGINTTFTRKGRRLDFDRFCGPRPDSSRMWSASRIQPRQRREMPSPQRELWESRVRNSKLRQQRKSSRPGSEHRASQRRLRFDGVAPARAWIHFCLFSHSSRCGLGIGSPLPRLQQSTGTRPGATRPHQIGSCYK